MTALAQQFRDHFGHRDQVYAVWLALLADDLDGGGPTAEVVRDHLDAPREHATSLRLLAGLHRIVLRGDAPELETYLPSLGGHGDPETSWPALRRIVESHVDELRAALDHAPQTNEPGRAAVLAVGLFEAVRRHGRSRVRLLEPGASGGLNLLVDRFRFTGPDWAYGPTDSPLVLDTECPGVRPAPFTVVERRGCDLSPVDLSTPEGRIWLTSFVWPFDEHRYRRLGSALEVAGRVPVTVDRAPASAWVREQLAIAQPDDVLTVVWQSITRQYWPVEESAAVDDAIAAAPGSVAHLTMEGVPPVQMAGGYSVAEHGPELRVDGDLIARSHHHGPPIVLS